MGNSDQSSSRYSSESDRFNYYDKLHFIPEKDKNERWAAQVLVFLKGNSQYLVNPGRAKKAREREMGVIDANDYKAMIDPVIEHADGSKTGGSADYFSADWKSCPIFVHLNNIMEAKISQIPLNLNVTATDQFAQSKRQKEASKIIGRDAFRSVLNDFNRMVGYPPLTKYDDPFEYAEQLKNGAVPATGKRDYKLSPKLAQQPPANLMNSLKEAIDDNQSLGLYMENIAKLGVEIACQLGIKYYMIQQNKYIQMARKCIGDIKNFNTHTKFFFTSETTGLPIEEYADPSEIRVLPFEKEDLSDLKGWHRERYVSFGDWVQMFGAKLTKDQIRKVFDKHRQLNNITKDYDQCSYYTRNNAKIRIGYAEFETQNMEIYASYEYLGNTKYRKVDLGYKPQKSFKNFKTEERHYNVWYRFYYMPLLLDDTTANYNLDEQAAFIYKFGKLQDQQREGDDFRYSKSSLSGSHIPNKMTWADIIDNFMPKINLLWFKFQNEMVNAIPNGGWFAKELVSKMAQAADDANNDNEAAGIETIRQFKQTGYGLTSLLKDEEGKIIGDGSPFREFKNSMMENAFKHIEGMLQLYNLMRMCLSENDITDGAGSKPRQNAKGIEYSVNASGDAKFFIIYQYTDSTIASAEKYVYYFKKIAEEGEDSERLNDFMDVVGEAQVWALKAVKDIPYHNLGLSVDNVMDDDQKQLVVSLAEKLAAAGILQPEDLFFIASITDVKYAFAVLSLKAKQGRKILAEQAQAQQQMQMQIKQMDLQIEVAKIEAQGRVDQQSINLEKNWDMKIDTMMNQLKGHFQLAIKQVTGQNKTDEMITQSNIEKFNKTGDHEEVAA